jgi:hypothetical protein
MADLRKMYVVTILIPQARFSSHDFTFVTT